MDGLYQDTKIAVQHTHPDEAVTHDSGREGTERYPKLGGEVPKPHLNSQVVVLVKVVRHGEVDPVVAVTGLQ